MHNILITGGAGFIGTNTAAYFLKQGWHVTIFDNLSRRGGQSNLEWLRQYGAFAFIHGDLRFVQDVAKPFQLNAYDVIVHLGGQVAVTTSVLDPRTDFEINALGALNLLEAVRAYNREAFVINASTNKVYGGMERVKITDVNGRYEYGDYPHGIDETYPLDFHSPYGCSKGCADQYMIDYARIYGLQTVTLRQSCIYGYRQFGIEDQGWVAWFVIAAALQKPITIYGDGKQVRDVLFIEDLVRAYECAYQCRETTAGNAYNIGGGAKNTLSLLELIALIQECRGEQLDVSFAAWRPGDQKVFVADIRKAAGDLGWTPQVSVKNGIAKLVAWVDHNRELFKS